jgi:8-oxo-dGTP diphosphatase
MSQPRHILVVSCLVRNADRQLLLVRHKIRGWELPQGRVEEGEALLTALHREIFEETGVLIHNPRAAMIWSKLSEPAAMIFCFVAEYASGELVPSEETPEVAWVPEERIAPLVTHPVNRDRITALLDHDDDLQFRSYVTGPYRILS